MDDDSTYDDNDPAWAPHELLLLGAIAICAVIVVYLVIWSWPW